VRVELGDRGGASAVTLLMMLVDTLHRRRGGASSSRALLPLPNLLFHTQTRAQIAMTRPGSMQTPVMLGE
jgi:hypothetical protein